MASKRTRPERVRFRTLLNRIESETGGLARHAVAAVVAHFKRANDERPVHRALRKSLRDYLDYATQPGSRDASHDSAKALLWDLTERAGQAWTFKLGWTNAPETTLIDWRGYPPRSDRDSKIPSSEMIVLVLGVAALNEAGVESRIEACSLMGSVMRVAKVRQRKARAESLRVVESRARQRLWRTLEAPDWEATVNFWSGEGRRLETDDPWVTLVRGR